MTVKSSTSTKTVLVVGAGPSGLAALKELKEVGLDVVAVDSRSQFGGVFSPDSGVTFEDLHLTISNMFMAFSDLPPEDAGCKFWSQAEYFRYMEKYVDAFGLKPHIELNTSVQQAAFNEEQLQWEVTLSSSNHSLSVRTFDHLVVASGANHKPRLPSTDLFQNFQGEIIHSSDYHSADQVKGKKVLVVGTGESSVDVACSAAAAAQSVTVWGRKYIDMAPRFIDQFINNPNYDEKAAMPGVYKPNEVLEILTISRTVRNLPLGVWSIALNNLIPDMAAKHGKGTTAAMMNEILPKAYSKDYFSSDTSLLPTKSCLMMTAAATGSIDIVIAPKADSQGNVVTFESPSWHGGAVDDSTDSDRDFDVIVACTGFELDFNWISTSDPSRRSLNPNPRSWFKHCFPPGFENRLAFVGFARPHSGGIPQCSEMVSRYLAQLCIGSLQLPPNCEEIALWEGEAEAACFHQDAKNLLAVDYLAYMTSVAKLLGCTPTVPSLLGDPADILKYWTFPMWPCFFRTQGVGANPATTKAVLDKFGPFDAIAPMPLLAIQILCAFVMPFVNFWSLLVNALAPKRGGPLPTLYKWRLSKAYFLYQNSLGIEDFQATLVQCVAAFLSLCYLFALGVQAAPNMIFGAISGRVHKNWKYSMTLPNPHTAAFAETWGFHLSSQFLLARGDLQSNLSLSVPSMTVL